MSQAQGEKKKADEKKEEKEGREAPLPSPPPFSIPVVEVEGVNIPKIFENDRPLHEQVQLLKALEMREDDVVVMAYAKSGTHWIWEVASMLLSGSAEYVNRTKVFAMMETTRIDDLKAQPSPRVLNSHLPFRLLPRQIKDKRVKVIHVYRNIKDVFVSQYFHFRQVPGGDALTFDAHEKVFLSDNVPTGSYFTYMRDMYQFRKSNPDHPVFLMSFEDTKEDPEKVIRSMAKFLGVEASQSLIHDIAHLTSFSKMRHAEKNTMETHLPPADIFRKGQVGDWKNYLTVAQSERLDAAMTQLESCDYRFRYTL
ncbi:sulfotransferase 1A1-like [Babylonia areolata]|uniref:sulfotransferase 1A1-like n=1 Tax=Babylonia areolata TaxID=304850 RepID=UPI003FD5CA27